jgi:hypothetical protein
MDQNSCWHKNLMPCVSLSLSFASKKRAKQKHTEKKPKLKDNLYAYKILSWWQRGGEECKAGASHVWWCHHWGLVLYLLGCINEQGYQQVLGPISGYIFPGIRISPCLTSEPPIPDTKCTPLTPSKVKLKLKSVVIVTWSGVDGGWVSRFNLGNMVGLIKDGYLGWWRISRMGMLTD